MGSRIEGKSAVRQVDVYFKRFDIVNIIDAVFSEQDDFYNFVFVLVDGNFCRMVWLFIIVFRI